MIVLPAERKFHRLAGVALLTFLTTFSIQADREVEAVSIRKLFPRQNHSFYVRNVVPQRWLELIKFTQQVLTFDGLIRVIMDKV